MYFINHKIHPFGVYNSVILNNFAEWYNHDATYTSQGSPENQNHNRIYRDIQKEIYYDGLAHTTMEPGKSHNLPFASPGKPEV